MDCRQFRSLTKEYIFDEINDNKIIMEYLNHAEECKECYDELEVIYSMYRALGDIEGPYNITDNSDYVNELKEISKYYIDIFESEKKRKNLYIITGMAILGVAIIAAICLL